VGTVTFVAILLGKVWGASSNCPYLGANIIEFYRSGMGSVSDNFLAAQIRRLVVDELEKGRGLKHANYSLRLR